MSDEEKELVAARGDAGDLSNPADLVAEELAAQARIREMFAIAPGNQKVFMDTMEACRTPQSPEMLDKLMEGILATNRSVFAAPELRAIMERHGALRYEPSDEEQRLQERARLAAEAGEEEPVEVDEDGYLVIRIPKPGAWVLTETATAYLDGDPLGVYVKGLFAEDTRYLGVYHRLLTMVAQSPCDRETINQALDPMPELQIPRVYAGYFTGEMEKAGALSWDDAWTITERGRQLLDRLMTMVEGE